jgi:hypothetical protein
MMDQAGKEAARSEELQARLKDFGGKIPSGSERGNSPKP